MDILRGVQSSIRSWTCGMIILLLAGFLMVCGGKSAGPGKESPVDAAMAEAYKNKIEITHLGVARGENYLGDAIYYIQGKAKNLGDLPVQQLELTFKFRDLQKKVILGETRKALNYKGGGSLAPRTASEFQVGFEKLPGNWNYSLPEVVVSKVLFR